MNNDLTTKIIPVVKLSLAAGLRIRNSLEHMRKISERTNGKDLRFFQYLKDLQVLILIEPYLLNRTMEPLPRGLLCLMKN